MTHSKLIELFKIYFPLYAGDALSAWFPNGKNSVRIRQKNGKEFIFSFNSDLEWRFETVDSFLKNRKEINKK